MYDIQKASRIIPMYETTIVVGFPRVLKIRDHSSSPPAHVSADPPSLTHLGCNIVGPDGTVPRKTSETVGPAASCHPTSALLPREGPTGREGKGEKGREARGFNRLATGSGWYPSTGRRRSAGGTMHRGAIRLGAGGSSDAAKQGGNGL